MCYIRNVSKYFVCYLISILQTIGLSFLKERRKKGLNLFFWSIDSRHKVKKFWMERNFGVWRANGQYIFDMDFVSDLSYCKHFVMVILSFLDTFCDPKKSQSHFNRNSSCFGFLLYLEAMQVRKSKREFCSAIIKWKKIVEYLFQFHIFIPKTSVITFIYIFSQIWIN